MPGSTTNASTVTSKVGRTPSSNIPSAIPKSQNTPNNKPATASTSINNNNNNPKTLNNSKNQNSHHSSDSSR